jgi:alkylated DNA repair dioxygenase AlkB
MADPGCSYSYSGIHHGIVAWTPTVQRLRRRVERAVGVAFNAVLLNLYRDGLDGMGWHADDESELVPERPIASLSLGAARSFRLRPRDRRDGAPNPLSFELGHGDLLVMDPPTQRHWQHQLPRRRRLRQERINLTFRLVRPAPGAAVRACRAEGPARTDGEG